MASTYTGLGVQLMTTGEKAGTWGTLTNTNWNIIEQISGGYIEQDIAGGAQTTTLSVNDGTAGAVLAHRIIKFTGSITGNQIVTIPLDVQTFYIILNGTTDGSGTPTVQFKYVSGAGSSVTWAAEDKGTKIIYATADDGTNPNIIDATSSFITATSTTTLTNKSIDLGDNTLSGSLAEFNTALQSESFASLTGTETLTNKTLTSPKIGTAILDTNGLQLALLTATGTAVNEFTIANAAASAGPTLSATGDDTNVDINITPKAAGKIALDGIKWPNADGSADQIMTTDGSGVLSFVDNSGGTSWQSVETGATFTAVGGNGYPVNTTAQACTATLPAGSVGDEVSFIDYARTFDTNNLTVASDSSEKIYASTDDLTVAVEGAGFTLVYVDATQGWLLKDK